MICTMYSTILTDLDVDKKEQQVQTKHVWCITFEKFLK